jgi:hypothetical protein
MFNLLDTAVRALILFGRLFGAEALPYTMFGKNNHYFEVL